jgi:diketogulonate reductase-like aldo/keto reductase
MTSDRTPHAPPWPGPVPFAVAPPETAAVATAPLPVPWASLRAPSRRLLLLAGTLTAASAAWGLPRPLRAAATAALHKPIPASGERLPAIGLGSWITFNVGDDPQGRAGVTAVLRAFVEVGGGMLDSSPMYGSSQAVIGDALTRLGRPPGVFAADKVWTGSAARGPGQAEASRRLWGVPHFDLLQVHNLLAWEAQLPMLRAMQAAGRVRYVGITTSEGRRHDAFEQIMRRERLDFVQLTYNPSDRGAERRLLPLAAERGLAVIANRPFRQGALLRALAPHPLPGFAGELGCDGWAQLVLKFIVSHPAVTCAIPATSRVDHLRQNMRAGLGPMPDAALRERIAAQVRSLVG